MTLRQGLDFVSVVSEAKDLSVWGEFFQPRESLDRVIVSRRAGWR